MPFSKKACVWRRGRDIFSEEFDHNALFHAPRYLLFAHPSSNSDRTEQVLTRAGGRVEVVALLKAAQRLRCAACSQQNQSQSYLHHLYNSSVWNISENSTVILL